jgi:hypothetical protein
VRPLRRACRRAHITEHACVDICQILHGRTTFEDRCANADDADYSAAMPWIAMAGRQSRYVPACRAVRISFPLDCLISVYYAGRYFGFAQVYRYVVDRIIPFLLLFIIPILFSGCFFLPRGDVWYRVSTTRLLIYKLDRPATYNSICGTQIVTQ